MGIQRGIPCPGQFFVVGSSAAFVKERSQFALMKSTYQDQSRLLTQTHTDTAQTQTHTQTQTQTQTHTQTHTQTQTQAEPKDNVNVDMAIIKEIKQKSALMVV